jgi:hypothetical protein
MIPSNDTMATLCFFHPLVKVDLPPFVDDFHLEIKVILNWETLIFTLAHSPHLWSSGLSSMVCELLQDYSIPKDSTNGFDLFFEICGHIVCGHVSPCILHLFVASWLLALEKQIGGIYPEKLERWFIN